MGNIAVLIMAAGASTRFGSPKQLAVFKGQTLVQRCIDSASAISPHSVVLVLGANHQDIETEVSGAQIIVNQDWQQGLGNSIACGIKQIDSDVDAVLVLLADQVQISAEHIELMAQAFVGDNIVSASYSGLRGVPAIFPRCVFSQLQALTGDQGAKALLQNPPVALVEFALPEAALDIDRVEDLNQLLKQ